MNHGSNSSVYIEKKRQKRGGVVSLSTTCLLPEPTSLLDTFCIWRTSDLSVQVQRHPHASPVKIEKGRHSFFSPFLSFLDTTAIISYKTDKRVKAETFHGESCATSCQISELHLVQILTQTIELQ